MTAGILTATCLCFMLSQGPPSPDYTNKRDPHIPVRIEEGRRSDIRELLLYASTDQGRTWQQAGTITPDQGKFVFYAPKDGAYWLRVAFVNKAGVQEPDDKSLMSGPPDLFLIVDTLKPIVRTIQAQRDGDEVFVSWDVQEDNPDLGKDGIRLETQAKDAPNDPWIVVPISATVKGQARFRAATKQPLSIRLTVRDLAKNVSHGFAETTGTVAAAGFTLPQGGTLLSLPGELQLPKKPVDEVKAPIIPPPLKDVFEPKKTFAPPDKPVMPPLPIAKEQESAGHKTMLAMPDKLIAPPSVAKDIVTEKVIADTRTPPPIEPPKINPPGALPTDPSQSGKPVAVASNGRKALPELKYVNNHQVMLEYELKRVGPSGVGGIELWLTKNDGETWEQFAEDEDVPVMPLQTRQKRAFEFRDKNDLPFADGIYGMNLVVKNRAGLGRKPRPGDVPEIRLEIDTKRPDAQLYQPVPDPQHADHVLLKWIAEDKNLTSHPITLEYAEKRDGPWLPIQTDVANTARYSWKVPPSTPVQVYLRLRVRDMAGNEGVAVTAQPQFVDLTEPEGALIGVQSQSKRP